MLAVFQAPLQEVYLERDFNMAYGILLESANGNLQISSENPNIGFIVIDAVASSSTVTYDPAKEIVFAKPASTTYTEQKVHLHTPSNYTSGSATFTFEEDAPAQNTNSTVNMNYIKGKWAEEFSAGTSGFGIQIYNSNNDLAYDSTLYQNNGGFGITGFKNLAEVTGNGTFSNFTHDPANALITTDITSYVDFWPQSSTNPAEYEFYNVTNDPDAVKGIYWYSFWRTILGSIYVFRPNYKPILLGEGGSV